jgi:hypothetical protein
LAPQEGCVVLLPELLQVDSTHYHRPLSAVVQYCLVAEDLRVLLETVLVKIIDIAPPESGRHLPQDDLAKRFVDNVDTFVFPLELDF